MNQPQHGLVGSVRRWDVGWAATDRNVTFELAEKVGRGGGDAKTSSQNISGQVGPGAGELKQNVCESAEQVG